MVKNASVAVFCGSRNGSAPLFVRHAAELGRGLAAKGITLIYGGGSKGLMGAIADAMMKEQATVIGVIPEKLIEWEHQHEGITELIVVADMHTRKRKMYELCTAAIILPGGYGTLDELFELLTWNQLAIHDKPIFILNSEGFYDHLLAHIERMAAADFLYDVPADRIHVCDNPADLLASISLIDIPSPLE